MISGITRVGTVGLIVIASTRQAPGVLPSGEPAYINGKAYVRLNDWAKANDLQVRWVTRDEALELSNPTTKLGLQIHSPKADINGVAVRLLFPLVGRNDGVYISKLDLQTTFQPVLYPPKVHLGAKSASICLDPGHGGKDPGFLVGSNQEKKYTLLLAQELSEQLKRAGWKVFLTRNRDSFIELPDRPEIARRKKADLFISLHFNAAEGSAGSVQGAEVYCLTPAGAPSTNAGGEGGGEGWFSGNRFNDRNMFLAYQVQRALTHTLGVEDRGVHRARFVVLCDATMPAVLIEAGFMSHPVEGKRIFSADYRKQMARAIADGIRTYSQVVNQ
jgi:N-acetylmuramoyl-L-alanine amidase